MRRSAKILLAGFMVATALSAFPRVASLQEGEATVVTVDEVRVEPLSQTVPVIGRLVARQSGVVAARIGGPVASIQVEVGDRVGAEETLATLIADRQNRELELRRAEVAESAARLKAAEARAEMRRQELARLEGLRESAAFSQGRHADKIQEVSMAESEVEEARASLDRTIAARHIAEIQLGETTIRAPYPGVVSERHTEAGSYLDPGDPVVTLVNDRELEVEADVPAARVAGLAPGMVVEGELSGARAFYAVVRAMVPQENPTTRTRRVRFTPEFEANGIALAVDESVTLRLPASAQREVVSLDKDAVIAREGKSIVFVVVGDEAERREVGLGEAVGGRFEVVSGLRPGELVVVRGNERLKPGAKVSVNRKPR